MTRVEILKELNKLTAAERLRIIEEALRMVREDIQGTEPSPVSIGRKGQMATAAEALRPHYEAGGELTVFTALDSLNEVVSKGKVLYERTDR